jgi:hypothetical protein
VSLLKPQEVVSRKFSMELDLLYQTTVQEMPCESVPKSWQLDLKFTKDIHL